MCDSVCVQSCVVISECKKLCGRHLCGIKVCKTLSIILCDGLTTVMAIVLNMKTR